MERVASLLTDLPGAANDLALAYTRRNDGRIASVASPAVSESWAYTYDALGRLTKADNGDTNWKNASWAYSPSGNMTCSSGVDASIPFASRLSYCTANSNILYNAQGVNSFLPHAIRKLAFQAVDWIYDGNGNVFKYDNDAGFGTRTLTWDSENRLVMVDAGGLVSNFVHGPDGERLKTFQGASASPSNIVWTLGGDVELSLPATGGASTVFYRYGPN